MRAKAIGFLAGVALAAVANASMITTLFATNNNGSPGGAVYFDITVGPNPITITGFDVNTLATAPFGFQVWTIPGTYVGNSGNQGAWTLRSTGSGTAAGTNLPSPVTLGSSFTLAANSTFGMTLILADSSGANAAGHAYTNGTGSNQNYSNSDLSLALGGASNTPFQATLFSPRVWNGTIYYTTVPAPASLGVLGLGGLLAARRRR